MDQQEIGGNIVLTDFNFEPQEITILKKIIGKYAEKIRNITDYAQINVSAKSQEKGKKIMYELNASVKLDSYVAKAESEGFNPLTMVDRMFKKIINEINKKETERKNSN